MTDPRYFPEGMPVPAPDEVTAAFWDGCAERELRIQRCEGCGAHRHTPASICSHCQSFDYTWDVSSGSGRIFSFIVVHRSVHPATDALVPYNVVVVELDDCGGVMVTSNAVGCANEDLYVGMPVRLVWEQVDQPLSLYRFTPVPEDGSGSTEPEG